MLVTPNAEELVDESLADLRYSLKVDEDLAETLKTAGEPLRLGPGDETLPRLE
jgi:hypothetical protein